MPLDTAMTDNVTNDAITDWMRQYSTQKRRCAEENGVLRNIVKRAKSDGINVRAMISTVVAAKLDVEDVQRDLRDQLRYMSLRRIPLTREQLFDGWDTTVTQKTAAEDDTWAAEDAGYHAGRHGAIIDDSPFEPGTELDVRWRAHWHKGQAAIARELGADVKVASTGRGRPSRTAPGAANTNAPPASSRSDTTTKPRSRRSAAPRAGANGRTRRGQTDQEPAAAN